MTQAALASEETDRAWEVYLKRDYPSAVEWCERGLREAPSHEAAADLLYVSGMSFMQLQQYPVARTQFERLAREQPNHRLTPYAILSIGESYREEGDFEEASRRLTEWLTRYPAHPARELAQQFLSEGFYFTIQVGAFASRKNAERLVERLRRRGHESYLQEYDDRGKTMYRVRVGKFTTRADAQTEATRLQAQGLPTHLYP